MKKSLKIWGTESKAVRIVRNMDNVRWWGEAMDHSAGPRWPKKGLK